MSRIKHRRAFLLLECAIALACLSLGCLALLQLQVKALQFQQQIEEQAKSLS